MTAFHRATRATPSLPIAASRLQRRKTLLWGAGAATFVLLSGCSKAVDSPAAPGAAPAPPAPPTDAARLAFDASAGGSGFVVGQAMAVREVRVFFDPQCPHCATLWVASKPLLDRIRMVWMPVAFIGPTSGPQGALLLAAAEPKALMDQHESLLGAGKGGLAVPGPADAALLDKIKANTKIWQGLDAGSVPHMVYRLSATGPYGVQSGGLPTDQLAKLLQL